MMTRYGKAYSRRHSAHRTSPDFQKRTPAMADTKAGAIKCGNRETSVNLNSTFNRFDAIKRYTVVNGGDKLCQVAA